MREIKIERENCQPNEPPPYRLSHQYEYKCPRCGYVNKRQEKMFRVVCERCGCTFFAEDKR